MILVLAGTRDARELAALLAKRGYKVLASVTTPYGASLLYPIPDLSVYEGTLDTERLLALIKKRDIRGIIDATHPFATRISQLAREAAAHLGLPYLYWERPQVSLPKDNPLVHLANDWEEAAAKIISLSGRRVFLAIGTKALPFFLTHHLLQNHQFIVRVLPVIESLQACYQLGLYPDQIVAIPGPGSQKINEALLAEYEAEIFVTKESGDAGGTKIKVTAACNLGIPVVVVKRPPIIANVKHDYAKTADIAEVYSWAEKIYRS